MASMGGNVPLLSVEGILCSFGLVTACEIVLSLFRLLMRLMKELDYIQRLAPLLLASTCMVQGKIFAWTGASIDSSSHH